MISCDSASKEEEKKNATSVHIINATLVCTVASEFKAGTIKHVVQRNSCRPHFNTFGSTPRSLSFKVTAYVRTTKISVG